MGKVTQVLRAHVGIAAAGAVLVLSGAGVATAAVITTSSNPVVDETVDVPSTTSPVSAPPAVTPATVPPSVVGTVAEQPEAQVEEPVKSAGGGSVTDVATQEQPVPPASGEEVLPTEASDPYAPYVQGGRTYVPAPAPTIDYLPGEPGYVPPAG